MTATTEQFKVLGDLFAYYNKKLFRGMLPPVLVGLVHSNKFEGAFIPNSWLKWKDRLRPVHQIVLNVFTIGRDAKRFHSCLVHEMVHVYVQEFYGGASNGYHCKRFAAVMRYVGLQASDTGKHGGKETGYRMSDYVIEGGAFEKAFNVITAKEIAKYSVPYHSLHALFAEYTASGNIEVSTTTEKVEPKSRSGKRAVYRCGCGNKQG